MEVLVTSALRKFIISALNSVFCTTKFLCSAIKSVFFSKFPNSFIFFHGISTIFLGIFTVFLGIFTVFHGISTIFLGISTIFPGIFTVFLGIFTVFHGIFTRFFIILKQTRSGFKNLPGLFSYCPVFLLPDDHSFQFIYK